MTTMNSAISWTTGTLNAWVGCTPVSAGCDHCYAAALVGRLPHFGHDFGDIKLHLHRLAQVARMRPRLEGGRRVPFACFVNSMSDFWHDQVPDAAIHQALDVFEAHPRTVFQILTKRPIRMRRMLTERYAGRAVPANLWFGVSTEDNRVAGRLNILRSLRDRLGDMTTFASVEPIIGPTDALDFAGLSWAITGGESGRNARVMQRGWLLAALEAAGKAGAAVWHKQNGQMRSHPNLNEAPAGLAITRQFEWLVDNGWEQLAGEKGGATVDRRTYRAYPAAYHELVCALNG